MHMKAGYLLWLPLWLMRVESTLALMAREQQKCAAHSPGDWMCKFKVWRIFHLASAACHFTDGPSCCILTCGGPRGAVGFLILPHHVLMTSSYLKGPTS